MENGIVQIAVIVSILLLALLFFVAPRSREKIRDRLLRKTTQRPHHRSHTHRHSG